MTKDLIKTLIAEYQQYVTEVKLIPRQVELNVEHLEIVTKDDEETLEENGKLISVIPLWKWLMRM